MATKEFKVSEYLTLKLEDDKTNIYVAGEKFDQCKYLAFNIPVDNVHEFDEIQSIDELGEIDTSEEYPELHILPEEEFWGHCSNLQTWVENEYDTRLLHSNISFPLLRELTETGDLLAISVFKEEIAKRITSGYSPVIEYLLEEEYLDYLDEEEIESLFQGCDFVEYKGKRIPVINNILNLSYRGIEDMSELKGLENLQMLQSLVLTGNKLTKLPKSIGDFKLLQKLDLQCNWLRSLPKSINKLKSLKKLYLWENRFDKVPKNITKLISLQILTIGSNPAIKKLPKSITKLNSLKKLDLIRNSLKKLPKSIYKLTLLQELYLEENHLFKLPKSITKLISLKRIGITSNPLDLKAKSVLKQLEKNGVIISK